MSGGNPYVGLVVDYSTGVVRAGTVHHHPQPDIAPQSAFEAKVVCDSTGTVVVRGGTDSAVKATAVWRDGKLAQRSFTNDDPNDHQWSVIEQCLGDEIASAIRSGVSYDAEAREFGRIPKPTASPRSLWSRIVGGAKTVLALAGFAVFVWGYIYFDCTWGREERANGSECSSDSDCASDNCLREVCRAFSKNLANGEECETDDNCASKDCNSSNVCVSR